MRAFLLFLLISMSGVVHCAKQEAGHVDREKALANALVEKELYAQAVAEYGHLIRSGGLSLKDAAAISDRMASIYLDKLHDPENALVCLMRVREYLPGSELAKDAEKRMVECLERTGRHADARYEASRLAALTPKSGESESSPILAQIEGRSYTRAQIERFSGPLRGSREQNRQTVQNVLASELLAQSALRKGLDRKAAFADRLENLRRSLLAEAALNEQMANLSVDTALADEYFAAHKERYVDSSATGRGPADFGAVRSRVIGDMINEKKQEMAGKLMEDLLRQAEAKVFDDRIP